MKDSKDSTGTAAIRTMAILVVIREGTPTEIPETTRTTAVDPRNPV